MAEGSKAQFSICTKYPADGARMTVNEGKGGQRIVKKQQINTKKQTETEVESW